MFPTPGRTLTMFGKPLKRWQRMLLGDNRRQQIPIAMTLCATAVYAVCSLAQWLWVPLGYVTVPRAATFTSVLIVGQGLLYGALRSGWTQRFADPALTLAQMIFALVALGAAYLIDPLVRGTLLMIAALVLVFGAFTLSPARCRALGWLALAIFGAVMAFGAFSDPATFTPAIEAVSFLFAAVTLPLIGHLAGRLSKLRFDLRLQKSELREALKREQLLATRDELTGLPNRRCMLDWMAREILRTRRHEAPLCIAMLDLDHFKAVNDRYGHPVGDEALVNFAVEAQTVLRDADTLARWGGEEFLLMLPDTPPDLALMVIQRLHEHLRDASNWLRCPVAQVTFSAGLAAHEAGETFEQTLARADAALYQAKHAGRDRCLQAAGSMQANATAEHADAWVGSSVWDTMDQEA